MYIPHALTRYRENDLYLYLLSLHINDIFLR